MAKRDFYDVLGVAKNASDDDIKKAYRRLAAKHHPDRHQGEDAKKTEEKKFKEANEAYEMLSDPAKRAAYDQYGHAGVDPSMGGRGGPGPEGFGGFAEAFGDIFGDIFGGGAAGGAGRRGAGGAKVYRGSDLHLGRVVEGDQTSFDVTGEARQVRSRR